MPNQLSVPIAPNASTVSRISANRAPIGVGRPGQPGPVSAGTTGTDKLAPTHARNGFDGVLYATDVSSAFPHTHVWNHTSSSALHRAPLDVYQQFSQQDRCRSSYL